MISCHWLSSEHHSRGYMAFERIEDKHFSITTHASQQVEFFRSLIVLSLHPTRSSVCNYEYDESAKNALKLINLKLGITI